MNKHNETKNSPWHGEARLTMGYDDTKPVTDEGNAPRKLTQLQIKERQLRDALDSRLLTQEERDAHYSELRDVYHQKSQIISNLDIRKV